MVGPGAILAIAQVKCGYGRAGSEEAEGMKEKAGRTVPGDEIQGHMTDIKGDRQCENLGASQVRRRLKGHGFGVRKDRAAIENKPPYPRRLICARWL